MNMQIKKNEIVTIDGNSSEMIIRANEGTLWITQTNDPDDHIIAPGEELRISGKGKVAIIGHSDAVACVEQRKEKRRFAKRFQLPKIKKTTGSQPVLCHVN